MFSDKKEEYPLRILRNRKPPPTSPKPEISCSALFTMAPSASEVVSILSTFLQGGGLAESQSRLGMLDDMISPDVKFEVVGEDSPIACSTQGLDNMKRFITDQLVPFSLAIVDKPSFEIVRAVGSQDSPWIVFEFKSKGTSKAGESCAKLKLSRAVS